MFGLGKLKSCYAQILDPEVKNMTLGIHAQQWLSTPDQDHRLHYINTLFIGVLVFRIVFEFVE